MIRAWWRIGDEGRSQRLEWAGTFRATGAACAKARGLVGLGTSKLGRESWLPPAFVLSVPGTESCLPSEHNSGVFFSVCLLAKVHRPVCAPVLCLRDLSYFRGGWACPQGEQGEIRGLTLEQARCPSHPPPTPVKEWAPGQAAMGEAPLLGDSAPLLGDSAQAGSVRVC